MSGPERFLAELAAIHAPTAAAQNVKPLIKQALALYVATLHEEIYLYGANELRLGRRETYWAEAEWMADYRCKLEFWLMSVLGDSIWHIHGSTPHLSAQEFESVKGFVKAANYVVVMLVDHFAYTWKTQPDCRAIPLSDLGAWVHDRYRWLIATFIELQAVGMGRETTDPDIVLREMVESHGEGFILQQWAVSGTPSTQQDVEQEWRHLSQVMASYYEELSGAKVDDFDAIPPPTIVLIKAELDAILAARRPPPDQPPPGSPSSGRLHAAARYRK